MSLDSFYGLGLPFIFTAESKEYNSGSDFCEKGFVLPIDMGLVLLACSQVRRMLHHGNEEKKARVAFLVAVGVVGSSTPFSEHAVLNKNVFL